MDLGSGNRDTPDFHNALKMILINVDNDTCRLWCVGQRVGKDHFMLCTHIP
jgi:hypothetical protein